VVANFAYDAGGWRVERHPRMMADVNNDGRAEEAVGIERKRQESGREPVFDREAGDPGELRDVVGHQDQLE
jgi:hypothetical protein